MIPRNAVLGIVALIALGAGALWLSRDSIMPGPIQSGDEVAVRAQVIGFGSRLKYVSLLSSTTPQDIQAQYAPYVAPDVLAQWASSTMLAPGRYASSPWPARIDIVSATELPDGSWEVLGTVVEVTSGDAYSSPAALYAITIRLERVHGTWMITSVTTHGEPELPGT